MRLALTSLSVVANFGTMPNMHKAPRGCPKDGECRYARTKTYFTRFEVEDGNHRCICGAITKLRVLSPGMNGEKRVSDIVPAHKAIDQKYLHKEWKPS